jgi:hypothetical protein
MKTRGDNVDALFTTRQSMVRACQVTRVGAMTEAVSGDAHACSHVSNPARVHESLP